MYVGIFVVKFLLTAAFHCLLCHAEDCPDGVKMIVDGLSVPRLTLLGRVDVARVVVDSLSLSSASAVDILPVRDRHRSGTAGKPPTPTRTGDKNKGCEIFVSIELDKYMSPICLECWPIC